MMTPMMRLYLERMSDRGVVIAYDAEGGWSWTGDGVTAADVPPRPPHWATVMGLWQRGWITATRNPCRELTGRFVVTCMGRRALEFARAGMSRVVDVPVLVADWLESVGAHAGRQLFDDEVLYVRSYRARNGRPFILTIFKDGTDEVGIGVRPVGLEVFVSVAGVLPAETLEAATAALELNDEG